jgi:hypothetical protein
MKAIIGVDTELEPGMEIGTALGQRMTVLRKVDLAAAQKIADHLSDRSFVPVEGEHFYEVDLHNVPLPGTRN